MNVGVIGCGNIFSSYMFGLNKLSLVRVIACADIDQSRVEAAAATQRLVAASSVEALLENPSVELVVNITPPAAHAAVTVAALGHGKHVYSEKPFATSMGEADTIMDVPRVADARLGCAPDTFLAGPGQTARAAIDSGLIGEPIGMGAAIPHSRAEQWHPDPSFLFKQGGGPLLDLGPYYISNLVNCLGPIEKVIGATRIGGNPRRVTAPGRSVESIDVEVPTHAVAVLEFVSGVIGTFTASFDIWSDHLPHVEIFGTEGILRLPDPDRFDGNVMVKFNDRDDWTTVDPVLRLEAWDAPDGRIRGLGVADLVESLRGRPQRARAELGYHVLEVLQAIELSSTSESVVHVGSRPERPEPVCEGDLDGRAVVVANTES